MIYRQGARARVSCSDLDFFFDDLTEYVVFKVEKLKNGQFVVTLLKKKTKVRA